MELKFKELPSEIINASRIIIDSVGSNTERTVKSSLLGGVKYNFCSTCPLTTASGDCGHHGKCPITEYIIYPAFIKPLLSILTYIKPCFECMLLKNAYRISDIINACDSFSECVSKISAELKYNNNSQKCFNPGCLNIVGSYLYDYKKLSFYISRKGMPDTYITLENIRGMLSGAHPYVWKSLNIEPPHVVILTNAIIIPTLLIRPQNYYDAKEHEVLTAMFNKIVKYINKHKYSDAQRIYLEINNNNIKKKKQYSGYKNRAITTLETQVGGSKKESDLRGHIVSKRCDNTGRCVIGSDNGYIGYCSLSKIVCDTLTNVIYYNMFTQSYIYIIRYLIQTT